MSSFFLRWLGRSVRGASASGLVAIASLAVASSLVFLLVAVSTGIERRLGAELRAYGANLLALPRLAPMRFGVGALELGAVEEARTLDAAALAALPAGRIEAAAPGLTLAVQLNGEPVAAVGHDLAALRSLNPAWRLAPGWPAGPAASEAALLGVTLARRLELAPGQPIDLTAGRDRARLVVAALVDAGGVEDESLILPLPLAQRLAGQPGRASFALLRGRTDAGGLDAVARSVESALPGVEVRTLRQVAHAEAALLDKVGRLLLLVTLAVAAAAAFTVAGTLGVLLAARRREIGLCLALGARPALVRRLLLCEAACAGLAGGLVGCALGAAAAELVARAVFDTFIAIHPGAPPAGLAAALAIAMAAAAWPVRRAVRISPCDTLRAP